MLAFFHLNQQKDDKSGLKWKTSSSNLTITFKYFGDNQTASIDFMEYDIEDKGSLTITQTLVDVKPIAIDYDQIKKPCSNNPVFDIQSDDPIKLAADFFKNHINPSSSDSNDQNQHQVHYKGLIPKMAQNNKNSN